MIIGVVDFGAGNLRSVVNALDLLGETPVVVREPEELSALDRIVLPGVGAAGEALARLREKSLDVALEEAVRRRGRPLLGICLGMQLLAERLYEFGEHRGLGWIAGEVIDLRNVHGVCDRPIPHMGWNGIEVTNAGKPLFEGLYGSSEFYFCHSFTLRTEDRSCIAAEVNYGADLVAAVRKDTVFATQFHPEKSQVTGEKLLSAFIAWNP
ncbi:MAG TPA: imidazole glycerol phosphate synthase subunit HisH [Burkholderiales bacterium]|nr:imidazole glycerol phosphate synthase subunit HisH [Burkholderiales bacterium]